PPQAAPRTLAEGHPWIFRDALADTSALRPGDVVTVTDTRGRFVARGIADEGPIAVRVLTARDEEVDVRLLRARFESAAAPRHVVVPEDTTAYRLVHGEGDRVPGVVCDVYGDAAVVQLDGAGATAWRDRVLDALAGPLDARHVRTVLVRTGRREEKRVEV